MESPHGEFEDSRYDNITVNDSNYLDIGHGEEVVRIDLVRDLQENPEELCTLLRNEQCDRSYWLAIAVSSFLLF